MGVLDPYVADQPKPAYDHVWAPTLETLPKGTPSDVWWLMGPLLQGTEDVGGRWIYMQDNATLKREAGYQDGSSRRFQALLNRLYKSGIGRRVNDPSDPWNGRIEVLWRLPSPPQS